MSNNWDESEFLREVREEFVEVLNNKVELQTDWWCTASEEWLADEIITQLEEDLDDDWVNAVSEVVIKKAMWTNDCWDICRAIIGAGDFADYRDCASEPSNINEMTINTLDQLANEKLDWKDILRDWASELPSPADMAEELDKTLDKCRNNNY